MDVEKGDIEFSTKQTIFGLVVYVRRAAKDPQSMLYVWGEWERAGQSELNIVTLALAKIGLR